MATKKKKKKSAGGAKKAPVNKKSAPQKSAPSNPNKRSAVAVVTHWVFVIFSLIMAVIIILGIAGGDTGALGEGITSFFSAIFGVGVYLFTVVLGYVGARWCYFNVAHDYANKSGEDYKKASKRLASVSVTAFLLLVFFSAFVAVIADQSDFDIASFFSDGWDGEGAALSAELSAVCSSI